jgi:hypothetical protein
MFFDAVGRAQIVGRGSAADLKTFAPPDANYLVADAPIAATAPTLLIYRAIAFAGDLAVLKSVMPKFCWQWLVGMPFLGASRSRSARLRSRELY